MKLFQNENVRQKYLEDIVPQIFLDKKRRLVCYVMKELKRTNEMITPETVIMKIKSPDMVINNFKTKHFITDFNTDEIFDMAYDETVNSLDALIDVTYKQLLSSAFTRFVSDALFDMEEANRQYNQSRVIAKAKGIIRVNEIIYNRIINTGKVDQIQSTRDFINNPDEFIRTHSQVLNTIMGGFTKGYVDSIGAKSGHTKSSWTDANVLQNLLTGKANQITIISPEESAELRWRRMFASVCGIPISQMRQKSAEITEKHVKTIREKLENKLIIIDGIYSYDEVIRAMQDSVSDMIYIDHINSIIYPGRGTSMENMIGGIPGLVNIQKRIAKEKHISIVNLSQVNDKQIQRSDRLIKAPRYWDMYGSSALYHAARELLMIWYPIKDYESMETVQLRNPPTVNDIEIRVEKSSFSSTGLAYLNFNPELNKFTDKNPHKYLSKQNYIAPEEKGVDQMELL